MPQGIQFIFVFPSGCLEKEIKRNNFDRLTPLWIFQIFKTSRCPPFAFPG
ncbi:hypothetical protein HOLDEFILI_00585 [Holdemania filiformis DSM 12042]|uniref:Uncharacterized protein n=1 Tax=Holdemania filiformis DSM 12042 TaxID=545696 RepID=B9Y454_9FIRM|nr:hypothetical protein HOLDEFILI_00585 [Holdemania filiformis DSM 12042]